jgi:hypothetical protein
LGVERSLPQSLLTSHLSPHAPAQLVRGRTSVVRRPWSGGPVVRSLLLRATWFGAGAFIGIAVFAVRFPSRHRNAEHFTIMQNRPVWLGLFRGLLGLGGGSETIGFRERALSLGRFARLGLGGNPWRAEPERQDYDNQKTASSSSAE